MSLPPSELWSKFQSAVRWARGVLTAGVAVIQAAPATQAETLLLNAVSATGSAPTTGNQGVDIEGFRTINLYVFSAGVYTATVKFWLYTGARWVPLTSLDLTDADGALNALDTEGYQRVFAQVTAHSGVAFSMGVFPYNAS